MSRWLVLAVAVSVSGCALVEDFGAYGPGEDGGGDATVDAFDTGASDGPAESEPIDSGVFETSPPVDTGPFDTGPSCGALTDCGGTCVALESDLKNCGACGRDCAALHGPAVTCVGGKCTCKSGVARCPESGDVFTCTLKDSDPLNCGTCGKRCAIGEVCDGGSCVCTPGLLRCGGSCTDVMGDGRYCGSCGLYCGEGNTCRAAGPLYDPSDGKTYKCTLDKYGCPAGRTQCTATLGDHCWQLDRDEAHCGSCTNACQPDELCAAGKCKRYRPQALCASGCTCFGTDWKECPAPGGAGKVCVEGVATCPS